jgi:hypothetical protein
MSDGILVLSGLIPANMIYKLPRPINGVLAIRTLEISIDANTLYTLQTTYKSSGLILSSNAIGGSSHHGVICNSGSPYNMLVSSIFAVVPITSITYNSTTGDLTPGIDWHPNNWPVILRSPDVPLTQIDIVIMDFLGFNIDLTTVVNAQLCITLRLSFVE